MLTRLADTIDRVNERAGRGVAWLLIVLVVVQFAVVVARHVFAAGSAAAQESIWYMHGLVFMIGAGYTLLHDGHVRLDLFYRTASARARAVVDLLGAGLVLLPLCIGIFVLAWPYVVKSWTVLERSTEAGGLPLVFAYKTVILVFAVLLGMQAVAMALRAWMLLVGVGTQGNGTGRTGGI